jgi:hypothetical protein
LARKHQEELIIQE